MHPAVSKDDQKHLLSETASELNMTNVLRTIIATLFLTSFFCFPSLAVAEGDKKPLRVYILVGQSNMVGTGAISTIDYIGEDPATAPLLKSMLGDDGQPKTCERVWISSLNGKYRTEGEVGTGKLSPGYGRRTNPTQHGDCIGPEYTFGITMEQDYDGPTLIIKTAWGGKSLHVEYRPPSAGEFVLSKEQIEKFRQKGVLAEKQAELEEQTGRYYRYMVKHVNSVLADLESVCPEYDETAGYELRGFVWFQGWNDYVATTVYPLSDGNQQYAPYGDLLCHFIRDVRKDLNAPELPFAIGVIGINGNHTAGTFNAAGSSQLRMERLREAMSAPSELPEFQGSVVAVPTAPFWDEELAVLDIKQRKIKQKRNQILKKSPNGPNADGSMTKAEIQKFMDDYNNEIFSAEEMELKKRAMGGGGFVHYHGSAKFHAQAGEAFAKALIGLHSK